MKINGKQVSIGKLLPGWSSYNKRAYFQTYDVTTMLASGKMNIINVILADGYYSGYCGWEKGREYYGKYPALRVQLMIEHHDGSENMICTDELWESSTGPFLEADILMGEHYDSRLEKQIEKWESDNYHIERFTPVKIKEDVNPEMTHYKGEEIRPREEITAKTVTAIGDKKYIVDFGQNFAGYVRLKLNSAANVEIKMRFAEVLNPDGTLYLENIRMARATDTYFARGDETEIWEPLFTYHGFRYCEVSGIDHLKDDMLTGISINSLERSTGSFISSHQKLNKLADCIRWNQKSNYMDVPTDCPQRDERFGWTGDASIYFRTASVFHDVASFYVNWFEKLFDEQKPDGSLPPYAPFPDMGAGLFFFNAAGWADAGIITLFEFYEIYKDVSLLERYYERMKSFFHSLETQSQDYVLPEYGYGDWLSYGSETSKSYIATAYFANDARLLKETAALLGRVEDAAKYESFFQAVRKSFRYKFIDRSGLPNPLTQTSVILAIYFNLLLPGEVEKAVEFLTKDIIERDYHTTAGFLGLSLLMPVLSGAGRNDIAWKILTNESFPSWFYMINNGATTLWEKWDSYHHEKGFNDPVMNSFNHCSLGSVGEWLYSGLGGIKKTKPGYKEFAIDPYLPAELGFVETTLKTIYGEIKSSWRKHGADLLMEISVPFNTKAQIFIPSESVVNPEIYDISGIKNGQTVINVGSGSYSIKCAIN